MNEVYATTWYAMSPDEVYTSIGHYSKVCWNGFYLIWDRHDCRYVVR